MYLIDVSDTMSISRKDLFMEDQEVKIYFNGEKILSTNDEIIIELPTNILKIKGDLIRFENKNKIKKEIGTFVCRE